ncbi:hypothetical protein IAE22_31045, partial [Bacillus sp. S34]|nr:hypothetical protein [Bacillus sp. S34]
MLAIAFVVLMALALLQSPRLTVLTLGATEAGEQDRVVGGDADRAEPAVDDLDRDA